MKIERTFPETRMRRIRKNSGLREMLAETNLSRTDLIQPIFIKEDLSGTEEIKTMPGINRLGLDILNDEVGKIVKIKTVELGRGYENSPTPPTLGFFNNVIVTNISGTFITNQSITSSSAGSGTIVSLDSDRGLLKIKDVSGNFNVNDTLTSQSSGTCTLKKSDVATASVNVVSVADTAVSYTHLTLPTNREV